MCYQSTCPLSICSSLSNFCRKCWQEVNCNFCWECRFPNAKGKAVIVSDQSACVWSIFSILVLKNASLQFIAGNANMRWTLCRCFHLAMWCNTPWLYQPTGHVEKHLVMWLSGDHIYPPIAVAGKYCLYCSATQSRWWYWICAVRYVDLLITQWKHRFKGRYSPNHPRWLSPSRTMSASNNNAWKRRLSFKRWYSNHLD